MLGGWSAEGSERYSRAAKHKIAAMQKAVSQTFASSDLDPVAEADDIDGLGNFLKSWDVPDQEVLRVKTLLVTRSSSDVLRDYSPDVPATQFELRTDEFAPDESLEQELLLKRKASKEKQQAWNRGRSELLGADHKQTRTRLRAELAPGYYISNSGKRAIKVLHMLVRCYMIPGVDYNIGTSLPSADSYDMVCKWCAKAKDLREDQDSSCTNSSSSSEEET